MDSKSKSSEARRTYEEFQPRTNWGREELADTVAINLPGYEKQQLKILLDNTGKMKISGERPVGQDNQWQRFRVDLQTHEASDLSEIRAKFDKGILTVTIPKTTTTPSKSTTTTTAPASATAPAVSTSKPNAKEPAPPPPPPPPPPPAAASTKPTDDSAAKAKEPPSTTPPAEATAPLICRPKSDGGFLYRHRKAAMGVVLAATALTGGIYVLYKLGVFRVQHGK